MDPAIDIDFDELEKASASLQHSFYDADQFDSNPFWFRESLNTGYEFRLGPRDPQLPQPSCRIDQDESGDFDPSGRPQTLVPLKRKRELALPQLNGEPAPRKPRQATWQFGRFNGLSLPVTLKLASSRGLHLLAAGTDNWPADDEPESSASTYSHDSSFTRVTSNTSLESYNEPYEFRPRDKACYDERDQPDLDDEIDFSKITLGHPAARGCPATGRTRTGPSLGYVGPTKPLKQLSRIPLGRRFVNCTQCRRAKKWCSLRAGQEGPCNRCKISDISCTFESLRSRPDKGKSSVDIVPTQEQLLVNTSTKDKHSVFEDTLNVSCDDNRPVLDNLFANEIPQLITKQITTRLAHPITFNFTPSHPEDTPHCHWCTDILHGLLGLGTLTVTVIALTTNTGHESSTGYTELDGGHTCLGHLPSRMCPSCTLERFAIIACETHDLSLLSTVPSTAIDQDRIMEVLSDRGKATWEWCSICPSPALYECCRPSSLWLADAGEDLENVGCGLRLCEDCAILLTEYAGNLEEAVWRKMEEATVEGNEFAVRADAEFLTRGGELLRQVEVGG
ncbi:MAG: hypothetical protein Q9178_007050 [Gyalolechia marmorata]